MHAEKFGWRVPEWAKSVGLSRAYVYELMNDGLIRSVKAGAARIITTHPQDYLSSLAEDQGNPADGKAPGAPGASGQIATTVADPH